MQPGKRVVSISSPLVRRFDETHQTRNPVRYILFVCVDPAAEPYVPQEDNIQHWVAEMDQRNVRILEIRPLWPEEWSVTR
jgi:hypothetical protein